jgi:hypothetical protein
MSTSASRVLVIGAALALSLAPAGPAYAAAAVAAINPADTAWVLISTGARACPCPTLHLLPIQQPNGRDREKFSGNVIYSAKNNSIGPDSSLFKNRGLFLTDKNS